MANNCPHRQILEKFVAGELSEADACRVAVHLEACSSCSEEVDVIESVGHFESDEIDANRLWSIRRAALTARELHRESETSPFQAGRVIDDYRLIRILKRGGMGIVFEAEHLTERTRVAFKVLSVHRSSDPQLIERFRNEIRIAQRIDNDCFVRCIDAGTYAEQPYLVMELLHGNSLEELVNNWGTFPLAEACEIGRQLAEALRVLKEQGYVHRDLKPANVMIAWRQSRKQPEDLAISSDAADSTEWLGSPSVVVLDFGIARSLQGIGHKTTGHLIFGTLDHMAPEQVCGSAVGPEADAYALGTTLFKLLVGRAPLDLYERSADAKIARLMSFRAVSIRGLRPDLPRRVIRIIDRLLARLPEDRPSPSDVLDALSLFSKGADLRWLLEKIPAAPRPQTQFHAEEVLGSRLWRLVRRPSTWLVLAFLLILAAFGYSEIHRQGRSAAQNRSEEHWEYLASNQVGHAGELIGHESHVTSLSVSSEENQILSTGQETREVILWDLATGAAIRVFRHHVLGIVRTAAFLSNDIAASGGSGGEIIVFDPGSGHVLSRLQDRTGTVMSIAAVPGRPDWLVSSGGPSAPGTNDIHLWNWRTAEIVAKFTGHRDTVYPLTVSPDGKFIASASQDQTVRLWSIADGIEVRSWEACKHNETLAWFPDSRRIATCAADFSVAVYEIETGKVMLKIPVGNSGTARVTISRDGLKMLTTHGHDPSVNLWDVSSASKIYSFIGNAHEVYSCALLKSATFAIVAGGNANIRNRDEFALRLWRLPSGP